MKRIIELMNEKGVRKIELTHHLVDVSAVAEDDDSAVVNTIAMYDSGTLLCYDHRDENEDGTYTPLWNVKNLPQDIIDELAWSAGLEFRKKVMVLYEVDEEDNTKTSIVAMTEDKWKRRHHKDIEKVLRQFFDERYADADDDYFCYDDEIKHAAEELTTGYDTEFNGDSLFWDEVEMM